MGPIEYLVLATEGQQRIIIKNFFAKFIDFHSSYHFVNQSLKMA